jgi:hypothetical protein
MPSFLSRIIDVVSIDSQSLLPVIHIYTTVEGKLSWSLLDCPCLENIETSQVAVGTAPKRWFGFHSAEQMINVVHTVEKSFHLAREDRAFRLLVTVADQAIQGEGFIRFTEKERIGDGLVHDPLGAGVCKFHVTDGVGTNEPAVGGSRARGDRGVAGGAMPAVPHDSRHCGTPWLQELRLAKKCWSSLHYAGAGAETGTRKSS